MGDLSLVEETRQVRLHLGASRHSHAQGKEATQVFLHKRKVVPIQALLPRLLGPMAFVLAGRGRWRKKSRCGASHHQNVLGDKQGQCCCAAALWDTHLPKAGIGVMMKQMSAHALLSCTKPEQPQNRGNKNGLENVASPHPHGKHAWTVGEGALVFEKVEVHLADVVLQVKCCGKVGLTVLPGADQHRLMGSVDSLVPAQQIPFLENLLAGRTSKRGCKEGKKGVSTGVFSL